MKKELLATTALLGFTALALHQKTEPLQTVGYVDLQKYAGKWYEIAAFPQRFENGCSCTSAEYSLNADGSIAIKNKCLKDGKTKTAIGKAVVKDKKTNAKLSVRYLWPFSGKYWIIALSPDYSYAVVGHPNRKYLWILSRKKIMNEQAYNYFAMLAADNGFDIRQLTKTQQLCEES